MWKLSLNVKALFQNADYLITDSCAKGFLKWSEVGFGFWSEVRWELCSFLFWKNSWYGSGPTRSYSYLLKEQEWKSGERGSIAIRHVLRIISNILRLENCCCLVAMGMMCSKLFLGCHIAIRREHVDQIWLFLHVFADFRGSSAYPAFSERSFLLPCLIVFRCIFLVLSNVIYRVEGACVISIFPLLLRSFCL